MLTYLEGARYKVQNALAEMDSRPKTGHPLASHINITRDKSGLQQSILKVSEISVIKTDYISKLFLFSNRYLYGLKSNGVNQNKVQSVKSLLNLVNQIIMQIRTNPTGTIGVLLMAIQTNQIRISVSIECCISNNVGFLVIVL